MVKKNVGFKTKLGYSKNRAGRTYTKKKALTKPETKAVAQIAKQVVQRNIEHKNIQVGIVDTQLENYKVYCLNPLTAITNGTGDNERLSDKIQNVKLRFKLIYNHGGYNSSTRVRLCPDSMLRVLVVRTKRQFTLNNSVWTDITATVGKTDTAAGRDDSMFYQPDYPYPYNLTVADIKKDNNYQVLYDQLVISSAGMSNNISYADGTTTYENSYLFGNTKLVSGTVSLPAADYNHANNYLNNKNTYIVLMTCARPLAHGAANIVAGLIHGQYSVEYTDA